MADGQPKIAGSSIGSASSAPASTAPTGGGS